MGRWMDRWMDTFLQLGKNLISTHATEVASGQSCAASDNTSRETQ